MSAWTDYLYRRHSPEQLAEWARSLEYFRFCRAYGGHNNDGDRLLVSLWLDDEVAAINVQPAFTAVREGRLEIFVSDSGDPYSVSESAVNSAQEIEQALRPFAGRIIDPPQDDAHCVCPAYYPEIWNLNTSGAANE